MSDLTTQQILQSLQADPSLKPDEKKTIAVFVNQPSFLSQLNSGVLGAGLALILSKFLKMSPRAQLLMTLAGYGIGKLLSDAASKHNEKFVQYNNQMKLYEIKD